MPISGAAIDERGNGFFSLKMQLRQELLGSTCGKSFVFSMKRLVFVALSVLSCSWFEKSRPDAGVSPAIPVVLLEKEPNNDFSTAQAISNDLTVEANLGADPQKPDEDWYVLSTALPQTVQVVASCPSGGDIALEVVNTSKTVLTQVNAGGVGESETLSGIDVSGKLYFRVVSAKKGSGGAYKMTVKFSDRKPGFELEPNERSVDSTPVVLGQAVSAYIGHANDVDVFRYEFPEAIAAEKPAAEVDAGTIEMGDAGTVAEVRVPFRIDLSAVPGVVFEVQALTEAEAVLFEAKSKEGGALSLRNIGARKTDRIIYLMVKSAATSSAKGAKKGFSVDTPYTLTVAQEDAADSLEIEPNNTADRAVALSVGQEKQGYLTPEGDMDVFRLTVNGPSIANVEVSGVEGLDLVLSLVKEVEGKPDEVMLKANEGGDKEPERLNAIGCTGSCLIRVETATKKIDGKWARPGENSKQPYTLVATARSDDGTFEREPNNKAPEATTLALGKSIRGTVFPVRDVDFYRLDLRERHVKTALTATLTGILKVDVGLYLHRLDEAGLLQLVQTADSAKNDKPETIRFSAEPGLYVFEVRDAKNRAGNFQDQYQLTVEAND